MIIDYTILNHTGGVLHLGTFEPLDDAGFHAFKMLQNEAWGKGYKVITMRRHDQPVSRNHDHERQGDEYYCPKCNKRWGFEDTPPECVL